MIVIPAKAGTQNGEGTQPYDPLGPGLRRDDNENLDHALLLERRNFLVAQPQ